MRRRGFISGMLAAGAAAASGRVAAQATAETPRPPRAVGVQGHGAKYGLTFAPGVAAPPPDEFVVGEVVRVEPNVFSVRFGSELFDVDARSAVVWQSGVVYPGAVRSRVREGDRVEVAGRRKDGHLVATRAFVLDPPLVA